MVKFDSLELVGFKSFAERTQVVFDDRVTAIIGPNGCGKSNLIDAIGWVLGTQNPRHLRGERMEDVVFNGTGKRKPSGMARVTLRLRRTEDQPLIIEGKAFEGETLELSRKLFRNGQSLYLINDRRCRLKDIQTAMESVGLGYASYALIAQGKMDSFLTGKPLDRRAIIEEAARITNYKSRRRSAELKLELAQQNLLRVNDIIAEVERSLRSLKRQASQAKRFRALQDDFRKVQIRRFLTQGRELETRLESRQKELQEVARTRRQLEQDFAAAQEAYRKAVDRRNEFEAELEHLQQQESRFLLEIDRTKSAIQFGREQLEISRRALQANRQEQENLQPALQKANQEREALQQEQVSLGDDEIRIRRALEEQNELFEKCRQERMSVEGQQEELRNRLLSISAEAVSLGNLKDQLEQGIQTLESGKERSLREQISLRLELREASSRLREKASLIESKQTEQRTVKEQLARQEDQKKHLESDISDLRLQESDLNNRLIGVRERLQSLQEVEVKHSQYSEGVRKLLNHLKQKTGFRTGGTLADRVETSPQFERLMEEFLDEELEYVLVDNMDAAVEGLTEVKALNSGRCTFLSIQSNNGFGGEDGRADLESLSQPGVFGTVRSLLQMDPEIEEAFCRTLPQRADAIVVADLDCAFRLSHTYPESTFITLEGEALTPRGLLASTTVSNSRLGLLGLKRQKRELEKKALDLRKRLATLQSALQTREEELEKVDLAWQENGRLLIRIEKEALTLTHQREQCERDTEHYTRAVRVLGDELEQLKAEESRLRARLKQTETDQEAKNGEKALIEATLEEKNRQLHSLSEEVNQMQERLHQVASDRKVLEERRSSIARTLQRVQEQQVSLQTRLQESFESESRNEARVSKLSSELQDRSIHLEQLQVSENESAAQLAACRTKNQQWKDGFPSIEEKLRRLQNSKSEQQERRSSLEVEQARLETQLESIREQCEEQCQISLAQASETAGPQEHSSLQEITEIYHRLKERIDSFGPINMTALEDYQSSEERHNFLQGQRQDIEASVQDTMKAIQSLNKRSCERFEEAFTSVNRYFQEVFVTLFGGGECGMRLLDEDDLLESGIEIYARPPGKKLQNVMLLSGGEKALTVLALLVGLFTYRPSRFCILDEVDAPLDDANVGRFNNLVRKMCESTQMILVTHNKLTMEKTDSIFGVTMAEPGISQVVSVKF